MENLFGSFGSARHMDGALDAARICVRCDDEYTERDNIGRWRCSYFHPLQNYGTVHDKTYRCCNRAVGSRGCVRADHTDQRLYEYQPKLVDRTIINLLGPDAVIPQSWQKLDTGTYIVHRIDGDAYRDNCSFSGTTTNVNPALLASPIKTRII